MKSKIIMMVCGMLLTGLANAECPSTLNKEELIICQNIEKTGANYQKWQQAQDNMNTNATISPITGKDIKTMTPAAGEVKTDAKTDK